ncbi:hypothetical protein E5676_scaffold68G00720 [Cucumis melo var. makuwa]|uniref:Reverse transcriptase/retrotransposon-derived protein RNase H-like domain-containing protein n=1 Tax=Cucumis melo var. makuwa TaxID=1194695 RepID=A0A5A7U039_CUCMM|nr:hypothetical protein E6C27_scaffold230G002170 [Cucumis melo var. makuwa]TYK04768.1 hypothetical protein E5676_scaffold68G00720 [Cucumis melo var. makuwa]
MAPSELKALKGYYNRFVEGFSKKALPLTELIKKVVRFEWIEECKKSFQELKCRITTARILALPTLEKEFEVLCDASHQARFQVKPALEEEIVKMQPEDPTLRKMGKEVRCKRWSDYMFRSDRALIKERRLCVPNNRALKESILEEAHNSAYAMHPESTKMYRTLKPIIGGQYTVRDS